MDPKASVLPTTPQRLTNNAVQKLFCRSSSKKSNLDEDDLGYFRPISHLSFLSKLTERIVNSRLADYLSINSSSILSSLPISNIILY